MLSRLTWSTGALLSGIAAFFAASHGVVAAAQPPAACAHGTCTESFAYRGYPEQFLVPGGVRTLTATLAGGSGGSVHYGRPGYGLGGPGGLVTVRIPVTPHELLTVVVGGLGNNGGSGALEVHGGYGGGGNAGTTPEGFPAGGAGGGGSFLFHGASVLAAAGGGGGGAASMGSNTGDGGLGGAGSDGGDGDRGQHAEGGYGATTSGAGAGGNGQQSGTGPAHGPATFGTGGSTSPMLPPPGAGGGGYYGGGAGGVHMLEGTPDEVGGGGGGSGYLAPGVTALSRGTNPQVGSVIVSYAEPSSTTSLAVFPAVVTPGGSATLTARVSSAAGVPSGSVEFLRNGKPIGTTALDAGVATLAIKAGTTTGFVSYRAEYLGAAGLMPSASLQAVLTVTALTSAGSTPAASATPSGPVLANTGPATVSTGLLSIALLVGGAAAVTLGRRRTTP